MQERELELATCIDVIAAAAQGDGKCIVLHGGAGVGKSRLLDEVVSEASQRGLLALRFRGNYAEHDLPLNFALRVLKFVAAETLGGSAHPDDLPNGQVPPARDGQGIAPDMPQDELSSMSRGLLSDLIGLIERSPGKSVLLAVDNLHWMDHASLRWLSALLERLPSLPIAVVATVCDGLRGTDAELLDEIVAGAARTMKLKPLSPPGAAAMIEAALKQAPQHAFVDAAMRITDGNPLLLEALVREAAEVGMRPDSCEAGRLASLSVDSLAPSLRVRLRRISPEAISIFRIAAVLGGDATVQNIADLSGLEPADIAENCHAMRKMGLLSAGNVTVNIAQPLMANSVLQDSSPSALRNVHAQAARLLYEFGAPDHRVATHLLVGGVLPDSPWVCETLRSAAREAVAAHDTPTAVRYLRRALEEPLSQSSRAAVQTDLALAAAGDDVEEAARLVGRALRVSVEEVGRQAEPDLLVVLGLGGYWDEVRQLYGAAQEGHGTAFDSGLLLLEHALPCFPPSIPLPAGVVEEAGPQGMLFRASAMARSGQDRDDAIMLASQVARRPGYSIEQLMYQLLSARVLLAAGELKTAMRVTDVVVGSAEARRHSSMLAVALAERSRIVLRLGDFDAATRDGRRALRMVREAGFRTARSVFTSVVAQMISVLTKKGSSDEALTLMSDVGPSMGAADRSSPSLLHALGHLRLTTGDLRGGVRDLLACGEHLVARNFVNPALSAWRSQAALGLARLGKREEACRLVQEELSLARLWGAPGTVADALRTRAMLSDQGPALSMVEEALALLRDAEDHLSLTHALCERGRLLTAVDVGAARQSFREAYELASSLGNEECVSEIRRELVLLGGRAPRARQQGVNSLTESERKVAMLAAQGLKNREIAAALYVEKRTVEIHLTHTYRKLGIDSRGELPKILRQYGGLPIPEQAASNT